MTIFLSVCCVLAGLLFVFGPALWMDLHDRNGWLTVSWVVFSILVTAGTVGYVYDTRAPSDMFQLETSDWKCTSSYQVRRYNGKIWYMQTLCAQYSRAEQ